MPRCRRTASRSVGNTLYLSGDIGADANNQIPDTPEAEATLLLNSIQKTLKDAGFTMDDLVTVTVYCSDVKHYDSLNKVYRNYFKKEFPRARSSARERCS